MSNPIETLVEQGKLPTVGKILDAADNPPPPSADVQPGEGEQSSVLGNSGVVDVHEYVVSFDQLKQLESLRAPTPPHYISSLPKETKQQREAREKDKNQGIRCALCGGWHHKNAQHVPYVGHAAVTDKLLAVDPHWSWEPVAWTPEGLPRLDASGGMWIRLTVGGMTRLGYGHAAQKPHQDPGAREKEVIGDALRNAAMRFGVALELWHKGELHPDEEVEANTVDETTGEPDPTAGAPEGTFISDEQRDRILQMAAAAGVEARAICERFGIDAMPQLHADEFEPLMQSLKMTLDKRRKAQAPISDDIIDDEVRF